MSSSIQTTMGKAIDNPPVEGKVRVYHIDGTAHDCWPVDAGEIVSGGLYSYTPPATDEGDHDSRNVMANAVSAEDQDEGSEAEDQSGSTGKTQSKEAVSPRKRSRR